MKAQSNAIILAQASAHLVEAYKALIQEYQSVTPLDLRIIPDSPVTYEGLIENAKLGFLAVTEQYSETAIYGKAGNVTFRIFHDYGHILYGRKFNTADESELSLTQWMDIADKIPAEWLSICREVYFADTLEQTRFEARTGAFPKDQKAFVLEFLNDFLGDWHHAA